MMTFWPRVWKHILSKNQPQVRVYTRFLYHVTLSMWHCMWHCVWHCVWLCHRHDNSEVRWTNPWKLPYEQDWIRWYNEWTKTYSKTFTVRIFHKILIANNFSKIFKTSELKWIIFPILKTYLLRKVDLDDFFPFNFPFFDDFLKTRLTRWNFLSCIFP